MGDDFPLQKLTQVVLKDPVNALDTFLQCRFSQSYNLGLEGYEESTKDKRSKNLVKHIKTVMQNLVDIVNEIKQDESNSRFGRELNKDDELTIYLAGIFHDIGKTLPGVKTVKGNRISFPRHHLVGAKHTRKVLTNIGLDPKMVDRIGHVISHHHTRLTDGMNDKAIARLRDRFGEDFPFIVTLMEADVTTKNPIRRNKCKRLTRFFEEKFSSSFYGFDSTLETHLRENYGLKNGNLLKVQAALKEMAISGKLGDATEAAELTEGERMVYYTNEAKNFLKDKRIDLNEADLYNVFKPYRPLLGGKEILMLFPDKQPGSWIDELKKRLVEQELSGKIVEYDQAVVFVKEQMQDEENIQALENSGSIPSEPK